MRIVKLLKKQSYFWLCALLLLTLSCEDEDRSLSVEPIPSPPVADIIDVVPSRGGDGRLLVETFTALWLEDVDWHQLYRMSSPVYLDAASLDGVGGVAYFDGVFWWLELDANGGARLRRSYDGKVGDEVVLPVSEDTSSNGTLEVLVPGRLKSDASHLYYILPTGIWRYNDSKSPPWDPIDLSGTTNELNEAISKESSKSSHEIASPRFISSYLPATSKRAFELVTYFGNELEIYRRDDVNAEHPTSYYEVSKLPTYARDLLASSDGGYIYVIGADGVYRSTDHGTSWFRFWKPEDDSITSADYVEFKSGDEMDSLLIIGTEKGKVYKSLTNGEQWDEVSIPEVAERRIVKIVSNLDGSNIWLVAWGNGLFTSTDRGKTWRQGSNAKFRSSVPFALRMTSDDSVLVADTGGLWRLPGKTDLRADREKKKEPWQNISKENISAFTAVDSRQYIIGTVEGELITTDENGHELKVFSPPSDGVVDPLMVHVDRERILMHGNSVAFLRKRRKNSEIQAWFFNGRVFSSRDQGQSWTELSIPPATRSVFSNEEILDVRLAGEKSTLMLTKSGVTHSLWLSNDNCQTWRQLDWTKSDAISDFRVYDPSKWYPPYAVPSELPPAFYIVVRAGKKLYVSNNYGETWFPISGIWDDLNVIQFAIYENSIVGLVDSRVGYELVAVSNPFSPEDRWRRYPLSWPIGYPKDFPKKFQFNDDFAVLVSSDQLWTIRIGSFEQRIPRSILTLTQLLMIFVFTGGLFLVLRMYVRREEKQKKRIERLKG